MKRYGLHLVIAVSVTAIIVGKMHWDNKISYTQKKVEKIPTQIASLETTNEEIEERQRMAGEKKVEESVKMDKKALLKFTKNLPKDVQSKLKNAAESGEPVHLVILGSASTSEKESGWPTLLKQKLVETYGKSVIKVTIKEIQGKTSKEVVDEKLHNQVAKSKPDILLIEPFLLFDNGKIRMSERLGNLTSLINDFKKENDNISVLIQPSNPIYDAFYYPKEEYDLQRYAKRKGYYYINHWEAWPNESSKDLLDYLTKGNLPNDKGNKVWAGYLEELFVNEG